MRPARLMFSILVFTSTAWAEQGSEFRGPAAIPPKQVSLEIEKVVPVKPLEQGLSKDAVALAIPTDIRANSTPDEVQTQILDHNIQNLLQGKYMKNSPVVQSAQKVQEAMKPSVSFGEAGGIQHNVNLEVEALQQRAKLNYTGFVDTNFVYAGSDRSVEVSMSERLTKTTSLSVQHQSASDLSMLKLNLDW